MRPQHNLDCLLCNACFFTVLGRLNPTAQPTSSGLLRLNLGSGQNPRPGYVNVDKFGAPDVRWDLEEFPWPWPESSVDEVMLHHVLEHLGESTKTYFRILQELYRVCKDGASVHIIVPHPRHDDFLSDPTHVRPFTPESFALYSQELNRLWQQKGCANSPLGLYLEVDFVTASVQLDLEPQWRARLQSGELTEQQVRQAASQYNNVIKQFHVRLVVKKPASGAADSRTGRGSMASEK